MKSPKEILKAMVCDVVDDIFKKDCHFYINQVYRVSPSVGSPYKCENTIDIKMSNKKISKELQALNVLLKDNTAIDDELHIEIPPKYLESESSEPKPEGKIDEIEHEAPTISDQTDLDELKNEFDARLGNLEIVAYFDFKGLKVRIENLEDSREFYREKLNDMLKVVADYRKIADELGKGHVNYSFNKIGLQTISDHEKRIEKLERENKRLKLTLMGEEDIDKWDKMLEEAKKAGIKRATDEQ